MSLCIGRRHADRVIIDPAPKRVPGDAHRAAPFRVAWFLLRPVASMVVGLASVVAVLVLVAHSLH